MNKQWVEPVFGMFFFIFFFFMYAFGLYTLITSDRYTTKQVVVAAIIFPYPMWISTKETYRFATTTSDERRIENTCWSRLANTPLPQSDKEAFCDCFVKNQNLETCVAQVGSGQ